jgi:hypothetical protein
MIKKLLRLLLALGLSPVLAFAQVAAGKGNPYVPLPTLLQSLSAMSGTGLAYYNGTAWSGVALSTLLPTASPTATGTLTVSGTGTPVALTGLKLQTYDTVNGWIQNNIQNLSSGSNASSDFVATANNGTSDTPGPATHYIDFGINGSGYSAGSWGLANDGYAYVDGGDLWLGTNTSAKNINFSVGNAGASATAQVTSSGFSGGGAGITGLSPANMPYTPPWTSAVATTQASFNASRAVSIYDFMTAAQISDAQAGTETYDLTAAFTAAFASTGVPQGGTLRIPTGKYKINSSTTISRIGSMNIDCEPGVLIDFQGSTAANGIFQMNGSVGTWVTQPNAMAQGSKSITVPSGFASTLSPGSLILISSNPSYSSVPYSGASTTCSSATISGTTLTLNAACVGQLTEGQVVYCSAGGLTTTGYGGCVITGLLTGSWGASGSTYSVVNGANFTTQAITTNGSLWYGGRTYYYQGEYAEVSTVSGTTITLKEPLRDTYAAT